MIQVNGLSKHYGTRTIFSDISFTLEQGEKVALVGGNGTGKTTLLKILEGMEDSDAGEIILPPKTKIGYLAQDTSQFRDETIIEYFSRVTGKDTPTYRIETMLSGFGIRDIPLTHNILNLSSGQKSKVSLVGILLQEADFILLDEPTNNLDLPALIWLENFLQKSESTCVLVSHDREFLDRVVRKVFELDSETHSLNISGGTYSDYLEMKAKRVLRQRQEYDDQQENIAHLTTLANEKRRESEKGAKWVGQDNDKFLRGFYRNKAGKSSRVAGIIDARIDQMDKIERPTEHNPLEIPLAVDTKAGNLQINLINVIAGYISGFQIGPVLLDIPFGTRVGIMGLNGSGKSTLLKIVTGQLLPLTGTVEIGSGIRMGNMMQEHETLPRESTLLEFLIDKAQITRTESYNKLTKFGFNERQIEKEIGTLSPGGRARLLLALFSAQSVNTLILDEPTNHLDSEAMTALEEALEGYAGSVLIVSHDRYFLDKAKLDLTYIMTDGQLTRVSDYNEYIAKVS